MFAFRWLHSIKNKSWDWTFFWRIMQARWLYFPVFFSHLALKLSPNTRQIFDTFLMIECTAHIFLCNVHTCCSDNDLSRKKNRWYELQKLDFVVSRTKNVWSKLILYFLCIDFHRVCYEASSFIRNMTLPKVFYVETEFHSLRRLVSSPQWKLMKRRCDVRIKKHFYSM